MFGLAVEPLADEHRPRKDAKARSLLARIVKRDVDDECDGAIERGAVRNVKRFGDVRAMLERELGDLRVRKKRQFAFELMGKDGRMVVPRSRSR